MARTITINIGLNVTGKFPILASDALKALQADGTIRALRYAVVESSTEPTLVAEIDQPLSSVGAYRLAVALEQDCIAQRDVDSALYDIGGLYGPRAAEWGPFDAEQFIDFSNPKVGV